MLRVAVCRHERLGGSTAEVAREWEEALLRMAGRHVASSEWEG